jgi:putative membrane protein
MRWGFTPYQYVLLGVFLAVWAALAVNPADRLTWVLENVLVVILVPLGVFSARYLRLSSVSYTALTVFLILHTIGGHYQYSEVPFGYVLGEWLGDGRNHYDRLVHFCFGLLLSYPVREVVLRIAAAHGLWGYLLPLTAALGLSALFEVLEWGVVVAVGAEAEHSYLGEQGDRWDAQKDMGLAGLGALITMLEVAFINWWYDPDFRRDLRESLRVKEERPLGEERLRQLIRQRRGKHSRRKAKPS